MPNLTKETPTQQLEKLAEEQVRIVTEDEVKAIIDAMGASELRVVSVLLQSEATVNEIGAKNYTLVLKAVQKALEKTPFETAPV